MLPSLLSLREQMAPSTNTAKTRPASLISLPPSLVQEIAAYLYDEYAYNWIYDKKYEIHGSRFRFETAYAQLAQTNRHIYEILSPKLRGPLSPALIDKLEEELLSERNGRIHAWAQRVGLFGPGTSYGWWDPRLEVGRW